MARANALTSILLVLTILTLILTSAFPVKAQEQVILVIKTVDGEELKDARVEVWRTDLVDAGKTNQHGEVTLNINTTLIYTLKVYYPSGHLVYEDTSFNYTALETPEITVNVLSKWTLRIWDSKKRDKVEGATVEIKLSSNLTISKTGESDENGKVQFGPIPTGNYWVYVTYRDIFHKVSKPASAGNKTVDVALPLYRVRVHVKDVTGSPVENIIVEIMEELDGEVVSSAVSDADGEALLKLVPNGQYYVVTRFKDYVVFTSEGRDLKVYNADKEYTIPGGVQVIRLNVTVYDADGEDVISGPQFELIGELKSAGNRLVAHTSTTNGVLRFGHVPLGTFKLGITVAGIQVYSEDYLISTGTAEGAVNAKFYDVTISLNATFLANSTITRQLTGTLKKNELEFDFNMSRGDAEIRNVPAADGYLVKLYFQEAEIGEFNVDVEEEAQEIRLTPPAYKLNVKTLNIYGEPISTDVILRLQDGSLHTSFSTDDNGVGSSGYLLPITYSLTVYFKGIPCAEQAVTLPEDSNLTITANVMDFSVKVLDKDREAEVGNVTVELKVGKLKKSSVSNSSGIAFFENIPAHEYQLTAFLYGFKVLEQDVDVELGTQMIEVSAPGILDARLKFLDAAKTPLDGGLAVITVGDREMKAELGPDGVTRFSNLPNTTIYVSFFYKGVEVDVKPSYFDLLTDEMTAVITAQVHTLTVTVMREEGEALKGADVKIYVEGREVAAHTLTESNTFSERLPEGETRVDAEFKGSRVASKTFYLDSSRELTLSARVYVLALNLYDTSGNPLQGVELMVRRGGQPLEELVSGEKGYAATLLPKGEYTILINSGNKTYEVPVDFQKSSTLSFVIPSEEWGSLAVAVGAAALNVVAAAMIMVRRKIRGLARRRGVRRRRRVPRI